MKISSGASACALFFSMTLGLAHAGATVDASTQKGAEQYAALMGLADAFAKTTRRRST